MAECKDYAKNLRRISGLFRDQISALQTLKWKGKRICLFLFGDQRWDWEIVKKEEDIARV